MAEDRRIALGVIVGAHGVRGVLRVKPFTAEPESLTAYGPLGDASGSRSFELEIVGHAKAVLLCRIAGIETREAAEALKGTELTVARAALPEIEEAETYYQADLVGLAVEGEDGESLGEVVAVHDFGAGDLLEIRTPAGESLILPFTAEQVPVVDLEAGRMVVVPQAVVTASDREQ